MGDLNKRKGVISTTETNMDITNVHAEVRCSSCLFASSSDLTLVPRRVTMIMHAIVETQVPLKDMFGYAGDLRSMTQVCT